MRTSSVDASQQGQPISKYIYGQFIEHLGRCIYGGIWAEMLEDRKFYFPSRRSTIPTRPDQKDAAGHSVPGDRAVRHGKSSGPAVVHMVEESRSSASTRR